MEAWHFLAADKRLLYEPRTLVEPSQILRVKGPLALCSVGLHASVRALGALQYAPGPIVCRVQLGGKILRGDDKACATKRTCVWMADATRTLHEFACWCAENALRTAKIEDRRCWVAIETKMRWIEGEATDEELEAARAAPWAAARAASWTASWEAARAASRAAAWTAPWEAAREAAWEAQNKRLEEMLESLRP